MQTCLRWYIDTHLDILQGHMELHLYYQIHHCPFEPIIVNETERSVLVYFSR